MINPYRILNSDLPERRAAGRTARSAEPGHIQAWLETLPRANQQEFLSELLQALKEFRSHRMNGFGRMKALETLRPSLMESAAWLTNRLHGSVFPLNPERSDMADQLVGLHRELALAYRIALVEACGAEGKVGFLRAKQVAGVLVRASYHHLRWLSVCHYLYRSPQAGIWQQLYALTAFAELHKLDSRAFEDTLEQRKLTPGGLQRQAILLALADPYRYTQREQQKLWAMTRDLAGLVVLTAERFAAAGAVVLVDQDAPPAFVSHAPDPEKGDALWVDLRRLEALVRASLSHAGDTDETVLRLSSKQQIAIPTAIVRRAVEGWSQDLSRGFERLPGGYVLQTIIGLSALHYHVAGEQDFERFISGAYGASSGSANGGRTRGHETDESQRVILEAMVRDQSLGGYRLRWDAEQGARTRIGELIGLRIVPEDTAGGDWATGIVRWLRYEENGDIEAGIDLLARRSLATGLRNPDSISENGGLVRALGLRGMLGESGSEAERFLVDSLATLKGSQIEIIRMADPWRPEEDGLIPIYSCPGLGVLAQAGDYLVVTPEA